MTILFNPRSLGVAILLLFIEVFIAAFIVDSFIRPFVGDVIVVVLIYCFLRSFIQTNSQNLALAVFAFACVIEIFQYFDYVKMLGLEKYRLISIVMGRTFEWSDFVAYFVGFLSILASHRVSKIVKDWDREDRK